MSRTSLLEQFPVEERLTSASSVVRFRTAYAHIHGWFENVERQARLREAAARGWINLATKKPNHFVPPVLSGRPLSELLNEIRD